MGDPSYPYKIPKTSYISRLSHWAIRKIIRWEITEVSLGSLLQGIYTLKWYSGFSEINPELQTWHLNC
jgi:hypothetical protein